MRGKRLWNGEVIYWEKNLGIVLRYKWNWSEVLHNMHAFELIRCKIVSALNLQQLSYLTEQESGLSKSHAKTVWGPQNLPKDGRSWGRFCRSLNCLRMGFTFLMDANTSKYFYNLFYGSEANSHNSLKNEKYLWNWEISFTFSWYLKISMFTFTS